MSVCKWYICQLYLRFSFRYPYTVFIFSCFRERLFLYKAGIDIATHLTYILIWYWKQVILKINYYQITKYLTIQTLAVARANSRSSHDVTLCAVVFNYRHFECFPRRPVSECIYNTRKRSNCFVVLLINIYM